MAAQLSVALLDTRLVDVDVDVVSIQLEPERMVSVSIACSCHCGSQLAVRGAVVLLLC